MRDENQNGAISGTSSEEQRHRSWWMVGAALLGLVVIVLAGAFVLDRRLRPSIGVEPAPAISAAMPTATNTAVEPTATSALSTSPVASSPLEREVEDAYLRYWDVLIKAYLSLDTSQLATAMDGSELARQKQEILELKAQGKAARLDVNHQIALVKVSPDAAVIYDEYVNHSVFLDPITKQEIPTTESPETEKISFEMKKINNDWKVIDAARHD